MCILFIYTNPNPPKGSYELILATNRDEYFKRPAAPATKWSEDEFIIGGKDLEPGREGGTWFAMSVRRTGTCKLRAGALLNITGEPHRDGAIGRGKIVTDYLMGDLCADEYIERKLKPYFQKFNGFAFVAVEISDKSAQIVHYTNVTNEILRYGGEGPCVIGFGNSPPYEPLNKVIAGQKRFSDFIIGTKSLDRTNRQNDLTAELLALLSWEDKHFPDQVLLRRNPKIAENLSSVYVHVPYAQYGTRTHTLLLVDSEGNVDFSEETLAGVPEEMPKESDWISNKYHLKI